jgi:4-hydroxybenzoate polyprenyltransferase/phosphoserine phosphatase
MPSHLGGFSEAAASTDSDSLDVGPITTDALFVDLDGTLVSTDVFGESLLLAARQNPRLLLKLVGKFSKGPAAWKRILAESVVPDLRHLPLNDDIVALIEEHRAAGCPVILATATDRIWADGIAEELHLFDAVLASDGKTNLKGRRKLAAIREHCDDHGYASFSYAGDSTSDVPIWEAADVAYVLSPTSSLTDRIRHFETEEVHLPGQSINTTRTILKALRPWQWLKNILLFVPLLVAHDSALLSRIPDVLIAFVAMSVCASGVYVLNDLLDISEDRCHPIKRHRPFAAGTLPLVYGPALFAGLLVFGFGLAALTLPLAFTGMLGLYLALSLVYATLLKKEAIADVILLAGLYTLRIFAGGIAADVLVSDWLLTLAVFLFTSLAFAKRHAELTRLESDGGFRARGRGYVVSDLELIRNLGTTSGYISVLVFALYAANPHIQAQYPNPWALWLVCPLALFWISRVWLVATRGLLNEDPVVFALKDRTSLAISLLVGGLFCLAAFPLAL